MNLYVHFPFCRSKCAYCALHSYVGKTESDRQSYIDRISADIGRFFVSSGDKPLSTLYFGGGTPAMCDFSKLFDIVGRQKKSENFEFTVELNPLDVTPQLLSSLQTGGVNRLSMGVQSLDDGVLKEMRRPHTAKQAYAAWQMIRDSGFDNAGIDLICGWPNKTGAWTRTLESAIELDPDHCSVYTLILEPDTRFARDVKMKRVTLPSDDVALAELSAAECALHSIGLERYEISNFAKPGKECRHNLATWRGEDYTGIGDGACSREGNAVSRVIFRLRLLKEGFSPVVAARDFPELEPRVEEWTATLDQFVKEGLLTRHGNDGCPVSYRLTERGTEVCDTVLAELV